PRPGVGRETPETPGILRRLVSHPHPRAQGKGPWVGHDRELEFRDRQFGDSTGLDVRPVLDTVRELFTALDLHRPGDVRPIRGSAVMCEEDVRTHDGSGFVTPRV